MLDYGSTARTFLAWRTSVHQLSAGRAILQRLISWSVGDAFNVWRFQASFLKAVTALKARVIENRNKNLSKLALQVRMSSHKRQDALYDPFCNKKTPESDICLRLARVGGLW